MTSLPRKPLKKSWLAAPENGVALSLATIMVIQAIWITRTFDSQLIMLPIGFGLSLLLILRYVGIWRNRPDVTSGARSWTRLIVTVFAGGTLILIVSVQRLSTYTDESINYLFLATDMIAHAAWCVASILLVVNPFAGNIAMIPAGAILVLVTIAGGGASQTMTGQLSSALAFIVIYLVGAQTLGVGKSLQSQRPLVAAGSDALMKSSQTIRWLLSLAVLSLILTLTSTLATATSEALPKVQTTLHSGLRDTLEAVQIQSPSSNGRYVNGSRFGSVRRDLLQDSKAIVLRIEANSPPGYLRGNVFDLYSERRWMSIGTYESYQRTRYTTGDHQRFVQPSGPAKVANAESQRRSVRRFNVLEQSTDAGQPIETMRVHNDPARGAVIFTPLSMNWIEAASRQLNVSEHQYVLGGIDLSEAYAIGMTEQVPRATLSPEMRRILLAVPDNLIPLASEIVERELDAETSPRVKANRISRFFQQNFTYSLEQSVDVSQAEIIAHFLRTRHPAHCEYFATATCLLLRQAGVPTRYVTGYVVDEESDSDDEDWIARNADAHAWVEAYDDEVAQWFPVESTPGRSYRTLNFPTVGDQSALGESLSEDAGLSPGRTLLDGIKKWWAILSSSDPVLTTLRMLQIPLLVVVAFLLWLRRRSQHRVPVDPIDRQSHKRLAQVDRRVRRWGIVRDSNETLHQFADRIETVAWDAPKSIPAFAIATWYRQYAAARYQGQLPAEFEWQPNLPAAMSATPPIQPA